MATNNLRLPRLEPSVGWSTDREIGRYITRVDIVDHHGRHWGSVAVGREHTMDREEQIAQLWAAAADLYDALATTICRVCDLRIGDEPHSDEVPCRECAKARAVLAKARGDAS